MPKYGILSYDLPTEKRSSNRRILKQLRRVSVMESWSCYLIPWGYATIVEKVMTDERNSLEPKYQSRFRFSIRPYDSSAEADIKQSVLDAMNRNIANVKESLLKSIHKFEEGMVDDPKISRRAMQRAQTYCDDAKAAAMAFALSDNMLNALVAFEQLIQGTKERWDEQMEKLKEADETEIDEAEATAEEAIAEAEGQE
jgi:hypothetical protein